MRILIPLLLAAMTAPACGYLADRYNASGADRDIPGLLRRQGVVVRDVNCRMVSNSREFFCHFRVEPAQAKLLIAKFKLREPAKNDFAFHRAKAKGCRATADFRDGKTVARFVPYVPHGQRQKELMNFTHMRFFHREDLGRACLDSAYGYG